MMILKGGRQLKNYIFFLFFFISLGTFAQQGIIMMPLEQDSAQIELEKQIEYRQLISGKQENAFFEPSFDLPDFDTNYEYDKRYAVHFNLFSLNNLPLTGFSTGMINPGLSPFFQNGQVLSDAAYRLGDKFVLGGYSYGTNSMFSAPLPNQGMNNFDRYGSTMFLQYKVSKNFKIETRVNVQQGAHPPGF
jgi:hypothetical protein